MKKIYFTPEMELDRFTVSNGTITTSQYEENPGTGYELNELQLMDDTEY